MYPVPFGQAALECRCHNAKEPVSLFGNFHSTSKSICLIRIKSKMDYGLWYKSIKMFFKSTALPPAPIPFYQNVHRKMLWSSQLGLVSRIYFKRNVSRTHTYKNLRMQVGSTQTRAPNFKCEPCDVNLDVNFLYVGFGLSVCPIIGLRGEVQAEAEWRGSTL